MESPPAEKHAPPSAASSTGRAARQPLSAGKKLLFSLLMVLVLFGSVEALLALLNLPPPVQPYSERPDIFWGLESNLDKKPFEHKELGVTFDVSTNSESLRYAEIPTGRQPETLRLLALGDSTTFGWGVEQDKTWPARLEAMLQPLFPEVKLQVLNGGVPGYTSFQGLYHFKKHGALYQPDLVLFSYIVQDARRTRITDKQQAIQALSAQYLQHHPLDSSRLFRLLRQRYKLFRAYEREQDNQEASQDPDATTRVPLDDYRENILTFEKLAQEKGTQLMLFGLPLEVVGYTKEHRELLATLAQARKLPHFDPSSVIAEEARQQTLYFPADKGHPNADGCERIATHLAEYLQSSGLIKQLIEKRR